MSLVGKENNCYYRAEPGRESGVQPWQYPALQLVFLWGFQDLIFLILHSERQLNRYSIFLESFVARIIENSVVEMGFVEHWTKCNINLADLHEIWIFTDSDSWMEPSLCCRRREVLFLTAGKWLRDLRYYLGFCHYAWHEPGNVPSFGEWGSQN